MSELAELTRQVIELREKVAFPPEIVGEALAQLRQLDGIEEAVIVSTCNRTELYLEQGDETDAQGNTSAPTEIVQARRQLLHRNVAAAIEYLHAANLDAVSEEIARHYEAGDRPKEAAIYYERAARVASKEQTI